MQIDDLIKAAALPAVCASLAACSEKYPTTQIGQAATRTMIFKVSISE
jgi:hypothetical protein